MGIRNRIILGFSAIGLLLMIAGVLSYIEFRSLNKDALTIIDKGAKSMMITQDLLDAIESQDSTLISYMGESYKEDNETVSNSEVFSASDSISLILSRAEIEPRVEYISKTLALQFGENADDVVLNSTNYIKVLKGMPKVSGGEQLEWFFNNYSPIYMEFKNSVQQFLLSIQRDVVIETEGVRNSAYRASMQSVASLATAIVLILIFYFLINICFISPIASMTSSLQNYMLHRTPFKPSTTGREEVRQLKELIGQLIAKRRQEQRNSSDK